MQELLSTNNSSCLSCENIILGPRKASAPDQDMHLRAFSRSSAIFLLYSYCKSYAIRAKHDVFGLYFCFDSFKYIDFNFKLTLPLLLSEQTSVLGKVFKFIFLEC